MTQTHDMAFDGRTFDPKLDGRRLTTEFRAVRDIMLDGRWHTIGGLARMVEKRLGTRVSEAGVSARIRDLRKPKFGNFHVARRRLEGGTHEYRIEDVPEHQQSFPLEEKS